ncbi:MAG: hypothetical protein J07HQW1_02276 [Haloquadratum walsbyi J07HQW1]|jgi:hypothetical protein|uniref:Uncharacterized protein n=1 Tax=Haloquadratum walsbyi J07HQW1 TaxID=1238424 RepID=U1PJ74_9EURY|nr:MAG: hypothetical protein J07HQW1_02276 [Haloquadratum walsbyi J07HQW1]
MISKIKLLALMAMLAAVGGLAATGAFTTVQAERTADVTVAGDANALLAIQPTEDAADSSFIQQSNTANSVFALNLDAGEGVNLNATTTAGNLFNITNNGNETVIVWISTQGGAQAESDAVNTSFYIDDREIGTGADDSVSINESTEVVPIGTRVTDFTALVDANGVGENSDIVISEPEAKAGSTGIDAQAQRATAVAISPGQSIRVSIAIEIQRNHNITLSGDDQDQDQTQILGNVTIFAVNADETETGVTAGLKTNTNSD